MAKQQRITTPFGRVVFSFLQRASYKFKKDTGSFSVRVNLDDNAETAELIDKLEAAYEASVAAALVELQQKMPRATAEAIKRADKCYRRVVDPDTGAELPLWQLTASLNHRVIQEENGKKVVVRTQQPMVLDSKNKPMREELGTGSIVRVAADINPWSTQLGTGISLRLVGVQVKEYVAPGAGDPGFGDVDGFEVSQMKTSDPVEIISEPVSAPAGESHTGPQAEW